MRGARVGDIFDSLYGLGNIQERRMKAVGKVPLGKEEEVSRGKRKSIMSIGMAPLVVREVEK